MKSVILLVFILALSAGCSSIGGLFQEPSKNEGFSESLGIDIKLDMVWIPAGMFQMGASASEMYQNKDTEPVHTVELDGFWMGKYEVTQEQYEAVMGVNYSRFKGAKNPVEKVSWNNAVAFCKKLSGKTGRTFRLPTEAEWEYACRAGTTTPFYFGKTISTSQANYAGNGTYGNGHKDEYRKRTVEVGSFPPNAFGLYDMHGNVWEKCQDWYDENYYKNSPRKNPQGPSSGSSRVVRGGCWSKSPRVCSSAARAMGDPSKSSTYSGFRVAVSSFPR